LCINLTGLEVNPLRESYDISENTWGISMILGRSCIIILLFNNPIPRCPPRRSSKCRRSDQCSGDCIFSIITRWCNEWCAKYCIYSHRVCILAVLAWTGVFHLLGCDAVYGSEEYSASIFRPEERQAWRIISWLLRKRTVGLRSWAN
jgi:hypothetical protein